LACIGVEEEDFRKILAVEVAGPEKGAACTSLLRKLLDRSLRGVRLVVSDDHERIKAAVSGKLPEVDWQRCGPLRAQRALSRAYLLDVRGRAGPQGNHKVRRRRTADGLAEEFVSLYKERHLKPARSSRPG
jgi:putative transposase